MDRRGRPRRDLPDKRPLFGRMRRLQHAPRRQVRLHAGDLDGLPPCLGHRRAGRGEIRRSGLHPRQAAHLPRTRRARGRQLQPRIQGASGRRADRRLPRRVDGPGHRPRSGHRPAAQRYGGRSRTDVDRSRGRGRRTRRLVHPDVAGRDARKPRSRQPARGYLHGHRSGTRQTGRGDDLLHTDRHCRANPLCRGRHRRRSLGQPLFDERHFVRDPGEHPADARPGRRYGGKHPLQRDPHGRVPRLRPRQPRIHL